LKRICILEEDKKKCASLLKKVHNQIGIKSNYEWYWENSQGNYKAYDKRLSAFFERILKKNPKKKSMKLDKCPFRNYR